MPYKKREQQLEYMRKYQAKQRVDHVQRELSVNLVDYSRFMIREIDGQAVSDLKASIGKYGVLQPILVFQNEKGRYEVICGNHRLCAAKGVGLTMIPVVVKQLSNEDEAVFLSLNENVQRLEMNPVREGEIYSMLVERYGVYGLDVLVERLRRSKLYIEGRISLWKNLHDDLRCHIGKTLSLTNALALSKLPKMKQMETYKKISERLQIHVGLPSYGGFGVRGIYSFSPYCLCEKCGSKHLKGVSVEP